MIYLDNASTTKMSENAKKAMLPYFDEIYGNPSSLHELGQKAKEAVETARENIAKCLNTEKNEIYFTSGGSESDNWAIMSIASSGLKKGKNHIITSKFEHHAVLHTLKKLKVQGFEITYLPVYEDGIIKIEDLKNAIKADTCLVTIMLANNEIGTIQPIKDIGALCREMGVVFHTDAVQAVGHIKVDVKELNVDLMSFAGHKFHGPKGIGGLFIRRGIFLPNFIEGGAQENRKRAGTENIPAIVGMSVALIDAITEMEKVSTKEKELRDKLFNELSKIPHSKINGDKNLRLPNNLNMCFEGIEGESLILLLSDEGICASSGSACTSESLEPSHVLLAIGLPHEIAHGSLRLTLSKDTTEEEIDKTIIAITKIVKRLRAMSPYWDELIKGERKHVI